MAKICQLCQKTYNRSRHINKLRGNYNRSKIKIQKPNLQKKIINGTKMIICVNCLKSLTKIKKTPKKKKLTKKTVTKK